MPKRYPCGLRSSILLTAFVFFSSAHASAQDCGNEFDDMLEEIGAHFIDPDAAPFRSALGLQTLASTTPRSVVSDTTLCRKVVQETQTRMRGQPVESLVLANRWQYSIFRIGKYVTMVFSVSEPQSANSFPPPPDAETVLGPTFMVIFEEAGKNLKFKGVGVI